MTPDAVPDADADADPTADDTGVASNAADPPDADPPRSWRSGAISLAVGASLLVVAIVWGRRLIAGGAQLYISAAPFSGTWQWRWPSGLWIAVVGAVLLVAAWPPATARLRWPAVLGASAVVSLAWSVLLAASPGVDALSAPLSTRFEYLPFARAVGSPGQLLRTWVEQLPSAPTHVQGHPPGTVLTFLGLDRLGVGDLGVALFVLGVAASAAPAALVALDRVAGRAAARRAAVFVGLAPAVVWTATSADAMFAGVAAWAVACGAVATTTADRRTAAAAGAGAGLLVGILATFTYGAPPLLGPLWALAAWALLRRRPVPLLAAAAGVTVPVLALAAAGFDWVGGIGATHDAYVAGVSTDRPAAYFVVANLAVVAVAAGPAAVMAIGRLRDRRAWLLVGGALAGVVLADVSGLSKGEVERIWLPLVPFLVVATCSIHGRRATRWWLAAQLGVAVVLQAWLLGPW